MISTFEIVVLKCIYFPGLDYEQQTSYSLTLEAKDGGNRTTTANILVNVIDVNDNAPIFEQSEYRRNIREGSLSFQPEFFVKVSLSLAVRKPSDSLTV